MKNKVEEIDYERIKTILKDKRISNETIDKLMIKIRVFCRIAHQLFINKNQKVKE